MIHYIIESKHQYKKKDGTLTEMVSYFQKHTNIGLPFNNMTGVKDEAKKYDCKSEAQRDIKKYFHNSRDCKPIKIIT